MNRRTLLATRTTGAIAALAWGLPHDPAADTPRLDEFGYGVPPSDVRATFEWFLA
ncbi:MAG: hypothetical protein ACT4QD_02470 [Acidobacteriota bacterium]